MKSLLACLLTVGLCLMSFEPVEARCSGRLVSRVKTVAKAVTSVKLFQRRGCCGAAATTACTAGGCTAAGCTLPQGVPAPQANIIGGRILEGTQTAGVPSNDPIVLYTENDGTISIIRKSKALEKLKVDGEVNQGSAPKPLTELTGTEEALLIATNQERTRRGLRPLLLCPNLLSTARRHCSWMAGAMSMRHGNYPCAENIAMGQGSVETVMRTWMNSGGHRGNILGGSWNRVGIAAYTSSTGRVYWTQQFTR